MRDADPDRGDVPAWTRAEDDERVPDAPRARRSLLLAVAVVPWVVVAAVLVRPAGGTTSAQPAPVAAPSGPAGDPGVAEPLPPSADPAPMSAAGPSGVEAMLVTSAGRLTPDVGDAVTVAVLVARAWFVGPGPRTAPADPALAGDQPGYVEHLWVEAVDAPWRGQVVVVLGALVLEETGDTLTPRARRLAVPVQLDAAGARAAGAPYLLPDPDLRFDPLRLEPVDDADAAVAAGQALADAGYPVEEVLALARAVDSWPWSVTFRAAADEGRPAVTHTVWLRPHLGGFVVAGWLPSDGPASEPPPDPSPDASPDPDPDPAPDTEEVAP